MKKKLIDSLKALPMSMEDKQIFADVILSNKGSNAGGFNEYYYIFNKPTVINDNPDIWMTILNGTFGVSHIITASADGKNMIVPLLESTIISPRNSYALMFIDTPSYLYANNYIIKYQGDIIDRYIITSAIFGDELTYEEAKNILDEYLTPISKEEFFALNELEIK